MSAIYDVIIIGAGHNGLVTAAYLSRAGMRVLTVERRVLIGGACVTEETWPGFKVSTASYVCSLMRPHIVRELELKRYGLAFLSREPSSFTPFPDGRALFLGTDAAFNHREIARFSARDAEAYPRYEAMLTRIADFIEPTLDMTPPDPRSFRNYGRLAQLVWGFLKLGRDAPRTVEILFGAAREMLDKWFESDALKATLATDAVIGAYASPSSPGTAYVLFHHVMGECDGARGTWCYVRGGMGGITQALTSAARAAGAEIRVSSPVVRILVRSGHAAGVVLEDGTEINARCVVSNADANVTFLKLLDPRELPEGFVEDVRAIDYRSPVVKINLALSELPDFIAAPGKTPGPPHQGTIHIAPTMDYIERAFAEAEAGRLPPQPMLECTLPSAVDSTLAPPGKHVMSIFAQYAPAKLAEGTWDSVRESFADTCLRTLAQYAPNIERAVIARKVLTPLDLERRFGLTGGNIFQGAMTPRQLFFRRPVPGYADYRTPIAGLYLCGAATHPGGGVMGACGYNAAREILRDRRGRVL